jgi:tetratricopeptide (TPR) repeat protein
MWSRFLFCTLVLVTTSVFGGSSKSLSAQMNMGMSSDELPQSFQEPMKLFEKGLGPLTRTVTTDVVEAQAFFNQGLQLMYAFTPEDAARSFREAQKKDPSCSMCYFGEAWAWGHYLNGPMGPGDLPRAQEAIQMARRLAEDASGVEKALIGAMEVRYVGRTDRSPQIAVDTLYSEAMADVYAEYPTDLDVGFLYAESLFLLEPRRGYRNIDKPEVQALHQVLEDVLDQDIRHPGNCHLYIHATESTTQPHKAEACAEYLGNEIPGASHIQHMPSHTWNRVGRWAEGVRANTLAWHSDQKAAIGEGFAIYPSHNLHMLLFAASNDGQGAVAMQAGKDYDELTGTSTYEILTKIRFGRFKEILEMQGEPDPNPIFKGFWDFGRGYAHLKTGDVEQASQFLNEIELGAEGASERAIFRQHSAKDMLAIVGGILKGEMLREEGRLGEAIEIFKQAVELEDQLEYDEPEPLNFSVRDWLGSALIEAGRFSEAEEVYKLALEDHPHNGWSLFGLEQALRSQGKRGPADEALRAFVEAWQRSDVWLTTSHF